MTDVARARGRSSLSAIADEHPHELLTELLQPALGRSDAAAMTNPERTIEARGHEREHETGRAGDDDHSGAGPRRGHEREGEPRFHGLMKPFLEPDRDPLALALNRDRDVTAEPGQRGLAERSLTDDADAAIEQRGGGLESSAADLGGHAAVHDHEQAQAKPRRATLVGQLELGERGVEVTNVEARLRDDLLELDAGQRGLGSVDLQLGEPSQDDGDLFGLVLAVVAQRCGPFLVKAW
jgi:hypothetical protein